MNNSPLDKKPQLDRTLTMAAVAFLVISSMIGSGVFKKVSGMSDLLGSPMLVMAALLVAGIITLMGALANAEPASMFPEAGGQYVYFRHMYGKFFAFLYGWTTFSVIQSATIASIGFVFAESLNNLLGFPDLSVLLPESVRTFGIDGHFQPFANLTIKLITTVMIWLMVMMNMRGIKLGHIISTTLATTIIICIAAIIIMCFGFSGGSLSNLTHVPEGEPYYNLANHGAELPLGFFGAFFAAMLAAFWAYEGWLTIGFVGGEVKDGNRNLPKGIVMGTLAVTAIYLLIHIAYLYTTPVEGVADIANKDNSIAAVEIIRSFIGNGGAMFLSILILFTTFNSTNTSVIAAPRVYYALAKDGLFFKSASKLHPKFHSPYKALIIQGVWATILVFSGSFDTLTDMLIFAAFIFYGAGAWGVITLRRKMPNAPRPYKTPLYPVIPILFTLFCAALVIRTIWDQPLLAGFGVILILIGIPFYFYWNGQKNSEDRE